MIAINKSLAAATLLSAVRAWGHSAICKQYPPGPNECSIITYTSVLQYDLGGQSAVLLNGQCNELSEKDWEPQSPGFKVTWKRTAGPGDIVAKTSNIGPDAIAKISVTVNGKAPP